MPPPAARISIVLPMLDEAGSIRQHLEKLQPLREAGVELVLVDGGSQDGTPALCTGLADQLLLSPHGRALQMNTGAAAAHGDILLFLHADTTLPSDAIAQVVQALATRNHVWGRFDVAITGRSLLFPLIAWCMNTRSRLSGIATGDQALFVHAHVFHAEGGFAALPLMEDIELSRRLGKRSPPACLRAQVLTSGRRWEQRGVWRTILLMWRLRLMYWWGVPAQDLVALYR